MSNYRNTIAFLFLWVYGVAFGHQLIPHTHLDQIQAYNQNHCVDEVASHDHVSHDEHFDEGWIGYLSCLLSNHNNHSSSQEIVHFPSDNSNTNSKKANLLTYQTEFNHSFGNTISLQDQESGQIQPVFYDKPVLVCFSLRGPPLNIA